MAIYSYGSVWSTFDFDLLGTSNPNKVGYLPVSSATGELAGFEGIPSALSGVSPSLPSSGTAYLQSISVAKPGQLNPPVDSGNVYLVIINTTGTPAVTACSTNAAGVTSLSGTGIAKWYFNNTAISINSKYQFIFTKNPPPVGTLVSGISDGATLFGNLSIIDGVQFRPASTTVSGLVGYNVFTSGGTPYSYNSYTWGLGNDLWFIMELSSSTIVSSETDVKYNKSLPSTLTQIKKGFGIYDASSATAFNSAGDLLVEEGSVFVNIPSGWSNTSNLGTSIFLSPQGGQSNSSVNGGFIHFRNETGSSKTVINNIYGFGSVLKSGPDPVSMSSTRLFKYFGPTIIKEGNLTFAGIPSKSRLTISSGANLILGGTSTTIGGFDKNGYSGGNISSIGGTLTVSPADGDGGVFLGRLLDASNKSLALAANSTLTLGSTKTFSPSALQIGSGSILTLGCNGLPTKLVPGITTTNSGTIDVLNSKGLSYQFTLTNTSGSKLRFYSDGSNWDVYIKSIGSAYKQDLIIGLPGYPVTLWSSTDSGAVNYANITIHGGSTLVAEDSVTWTPSDLLIGSPGTIQVKQNILPGNLAFTGALFAPFRDAVGDITLDLSDLSNLSYSNVSGTFEVGSIGNTPQGLGTTSTIKLPKGITTITAPQVKIGTVRSYSSTSRNVTDLTLSTKTEITATDVTIGGSDTNTTVQAESDSIARHQDQYGAKYFTATISGNLIVGLSSEGTFSETVNSSAHLDLSNTSSFLSMSSGKIIIAKKTSSAQGSVTGQLTLSQSSAAQNNITSITLGYSNSNYFSESSLNSTFLQNGAPIDLSGATGILLGGLESSSPNVTFNSNYMLKRGDLYTSKVTTIGVTSGGGSTSSFAVKPNSTLNFTFAGGSIYPKTTSNAKTLEFEGSSVSGRDLNVVLSANTSSFIKADYDRYWVSLPFGMGYWVDNPDQVTFGLNTNISGTGSLIFTGSDPANFAGGNLNLNSDFNGGVLHIANGVLKPGSEITLTNLVLGDAYNQNAKVNINQLLYVTNLKSLAGLGVTSKKYFYTDSAVRGSIVILSDSRHVYVGDMGYDVNSGSNPGYGDNLSPLTIAIMDGSGVGRGTTVLGGTLYPYNSNTKVRVLSGVLELASNNAIGTGVNSDTGTGNTGDAILEMAGGILRFTPKNTKDYSPAFTRTTNSKAYYIDTNSLNIAFNSEIGYPDLSAWSDTTGYDIGDRVLYSGKAYELYYFISFIGGPSLYYSDIPPPNNTVHWKEIAYPIIINWSSTKAYSAGDRIIYGGSVFVAKLPSQNIVPTSAADNGVYWERFVTLKKLGAGQLTLKGIQSLKGDFNNYAGTLYLNDYTVPTARKTFNGGYLNMFGGTVYMDGPTSSWLIESVSTTTFQRGHSTIIARDGIDFTAGILLRSKGATGYFQSSTTGSYSGFTRTTTSIPSNQRGIFYSEGASGPAAATDWATVTNGIIGDLASTNTSWGSGIDTYISASTNSGNSTTNSLRFANASSSVSLGLNSTTTLQSGGILVSSNMSGKTVTINSSGLFTSSPNSEFLIYTGSTLTIDSDILSQNMPTIINQNSTPVKASLVKAGPSSLYLTGTNTFFDLYLNEGTLVVSEDVQLGALSSYFSRSMPARTVYMSGGTLKIDTRQVIGYLPWGGTIFITDNSGFSTARDFYFNPDSNSTIETDGNLSITGTLNGSGTLLKKGLGGLSALGSGSFQGDAKVLEGTLILGPNGGLVGPGGYLEAVDQAQISTYSSAVVPVQINRPVILSTLAYDPNAAAVSYGPKVLSNSPGMAFNKTVTIPAYATFEDGNFQFNDPLAIFSAGSGYINVGSNITFNNCNATVNGEFATGAETYLYLNSSNLTLNCAGVMGGTITLDSGSTLSLGHPAALGSANIVVNGGTIKILEGFSGGFINISSSSTAVSIDTDGNNLSLSPISKPLIKKGAGHLYVATSSNVTINGGSLHVGGTIGNVVLAGGSLYGTGDSQASTKTISMTADSSLSGTLSIAGRIIGGFSPTALTIEEGASVTLSNVSNTQFGTNIKGDLNFSSDGNLGSNTAPIRFQGGKLIGTTGSSIGTNRVIYVDTTGKLDGNSTVYADLSGSGKLYKLGSGTWTLYGDGTSFAGSFRPYAGTTQIAYSDALASARLEMINVDSGSLTFLSTVSTFSVGSLSGDRNITLGSAVSNIVLSSASGINTYVGNITQVVAAGLQKTGAGTQHLLGTNNLTGPVTITGGTLGFASGSLGSTGDLTLSNSTLKWLGENNEDLSGSRTITISGSSTLEMDNDTIFSDGVFGTGTLTKAGRGLLSVYGPITPANLVLSAGSGTGGISIETSSNLNSVTSITFNSSSVLRWGDGYNFDISSGSRNVVFGSGSTAIFDVTSSQTDISNPIGGGGSGTLEKRGFGTLRLLAENTFTGGVIVSEGVLSINSGELGFGALPGSIVSNHVTLKGGTLRNSDTGDILKIKRERGVLLAGATGSALDTGTGGIECQSNISEATSGGQADLTKLGEGTLYLRGTLNTSGRFNIDVGRVSASRESYTDLAGNFLGLSGEISVSAGAFLDIDLTDTQTATYTLNKSLTGSGIINISNNGNLASGAVNRNLSIGSPGSEFEGAIKVKSTGTTLTSVESGYRVFKVGAASSAPAWDSSTQYSRGSYVTDDNIIYVAVQTNLNKPPKNNTTYWERYGISVEDTNSSWAEINSGVSLDNQFYLTGDGPSSGALRLSDSTTLTGKVHISETGAKIGRYTSSSTSVLFKQTANFYGGHLTLKDLAATTDAANYHNATTIDGGTLTIDNQGNMGPGEVILNTAASGLIIKRSNNHLFSNNISGSGYLKIDRGQAYTFTGNHSYSGNLQVSASAAKFILGAGSTLGTLSVGDILLGVGTEIHINKSNTTGINSPIYGPGTFKQLGTGTTIIGQDNSSFSGSIIVTTGKLQIGNGGIYCSMGGSAGTNQYSVATGSSLAFNFVMPAMIDPVIAEYTVANNITGTGSLILESGDTKFNDISQFAGPITVRPSGLIRLPPNTTLNTQPTVTLEEGSGLSSEGKITLGGATCLVVEGAAHNFLYINGDLVFNANPGVTSLKLGV